MRIGIDARMLGRTGIGTYVAGLLSVMPAATAPDQLTIFTRPQERARAAELTALGPNVSLRLAPGAIYRLREQFDFPLRLLRARLDLLHSPHYNRPLIDRHPSVVTIHDLIPLVYPGIHSSGMARRYNRLLIEAAVRAARLVIAPSAHTARDLERLLRVPERKIRVIPEAADDRWRPLPPGAPRVHALDTLGIRPPFIFYTGQWKPYKNVPLLLDAFAGLTARHPDLQLVIGGRPDPRYPEVVERARALGERVILTGWIEDDALPAVMASAACFVFPSAYEGFGLPVLEAMACGTPVVCADATSVPEVCGEAAILWSIPSGGAGLEVAIERALDPSESAHLRAKGLTQSGRFSWAETGRQTAAVYREVLG